MQMTLLLHLCLQESNGGDHLRCLSMSYRTPDKSDMNMPL